MKVIRYETFELYYDVVQLHNKTFWLMTTDQFFGPEALYQLVLCRELTLLQFCDVFYYQNLNPENPNSKINLRSQMNKRSYSYLDNNNCI